MIDFRILGLANCAHERFGISIRSVATKISSFINL